MGLVVGWHMAFHPCISVRHADEDLGPEPNSDQESSMVAESVLVYGPYRAQCEPSSEVTSESGIVVTAGGG